MLAITVLILILATYASSQALDSGVLQIRGIPVMKNPLYRPDRDFECLDGSRIIPFTWINDDYCDCGDGSDEPGTSACVNGVFYCENINHKPAYIPSSWVNDGVCDCCDTSDEYESGKNCVNNCNELGTEARLEQKKAEQLAREGNKLRLELVTKGKIVKAEYASRLAKLRTDYEEAQLTKKEKEIVKIQAEERESVALEKYKPSELEEPATEDTADGEEDLTEAENYFKMLDSNSDGKVTIEELQTRSTFDKNKDSAVSEEEALYFLSEKKEVDLQEFMDLAWMNIKPFLMLDKGMFKPTISDKVEEQLSLDDANHEKEDEREMIEENGVPEEEHEEKYEEEHEEEYEEDHKKEHEKEAEVSYDEETLALIDEANIARERFQEAEKAVNDLQSEIKQLEDKLQRDYGQNEEFAPLDGECFEYTDLEYVYNLCLYNKATQKSRSGGSDVHLGHWNTWVGPPGAKYTKMKYDRGVTCWNGPARSTIVTLTCGIENKLMSVTEPSRCEYAMELSTPAICNFNQTETDIHDEL